MGNFERADNSMCWGLVISGGVELSLLEMLLATSKLPRFSVAATVLAENWREGAGLGRKVETGGPSEGLCRKRTDEGASAILELTTRPNHLRRTIIPLMTKGTM